MVNSAMLLLLFSIMPVKLTYWANIARHVEHVKIGSLVICVNYIHIQIQPLNPIRIFFTKYQKVPLYAVVYLISSTL